MSAPKKPKLSDVDWMTVTLVPVTRCVPPEGVSCHLQGGSVYPTAADAKRHALEHPGHLVYREVVQRTSYVLRGTVTE